MKKKILLIFGSEGGLGRGITESLSKDEYDEIYLYDMGFSGEHGDKRIVTNVIKDLSKGQNTAGLFDGISADRDTQLFLISTIGGYAGGVNLEEFGEDDTDKMLSINFKSAVNILQEFIGLAGKQVTLPLFLLPR